MANRWLIKPSGQLLGQRKRLITPSSRHIKLSGDRVVAGGYIPYAVKMLRDLARLEKTSSQTGRDKLTTFSKNVALFNAYILVTRTSMPGSSIIFEEIYIDAAGGTPGDWVCWPKSEEFPLGWGPPFVNPITGEPLNDGLGTPGRAPQYINLGVDENNQWSVTKRGVEKLYGRTDWVGPPNLPSVTWDGPPERYFPHGWAEGHQPIWALGRKLFVGGTQTFFNGKPQEGVAILGACLRMKRVQKLDEEGNPVPPPEGSDDPVTEIGLFLIFVVDPGPFSISDIKIEVRTAKVGTVAADTGIISLSGHTPPLESPAQDPVIDGEWSPQNLTGFRRAAVFLGEEVAVFESPFSNPANHIRQGSPYFFNASGTEACSACVNKKWMITVLDGNEDGESLFPDISEDFTAEMTITDGPPPLVYEYQDNRVWDPILNRYKPQNYVESSTSHKGDFLAAFDYEGDTLRTMTFHTDWYSEGKASVSTNNVGSEGWPCYLSIKHNIPSQFRGDFRMIVTDDTGQVMDFPTCVYDYDTHGLITEVYPMCAEPCGAGPTTPGPGQVGGGPGGCFNQGYRRYTWTETSARDPMKAVALVLIDMRSIPEAFFWEYETAHNRDTPRNHSDILAIVDFTFQEGWLRFKSFRDGILYEQQNPPRDPDLSPW